MVAKGSKKLFADNLVGCGYVLRFPNAKDNFMNTIFRIPIDLVEAGEYPGDGKPHILSVQICLCLILSVNSDAINFFTNVFCVCINLWKFFSSH